MKVGKLAFNIESDTPLPTFISCTWVITSPRMKRRRRTSKKEFSEAKFTRGPSKAQLLAEQGALVLSTMRTIGICHPQPYFIPANLATGVCYTGYNAIVLSRATPTGQPPLFCTIKQANYAMHTNVRLGEKALGRIVYYTYKEGGEDEGSRMQWTPVFHVSQLAPTPMIEARLRDYDLKMRLALAPRWMSKLESLYKHREALPGDHAIALAPAAVPPLVLLAARATLVHPPSPARLELLTDDLRQLMWPLGGLVQADTLLDRLWARDPAITPALPADADRTLFEAGLPRSHFADAPSYYVATFYELAHAALAPHYETDTVLRAAVALGMLTLLAEAQLDARSLPLPLALRGSTDDLTEARLLRVLQQAGAVTLNVAHGRVV
jgi:hypothetical protein